MKKIVLMICLCALILCFVSCEAEVKDTEKNSEEITDTAELKPESESEITEESAKLPETLPESEPTTQPAETEPETDIPAETEPLPDFDQYASLEKCEPGKWYSTYNHLYFGNGSNLDFYDYDMSYNVDADDGYYKGTLLLPGYEDPHVFYVESETEEEVKVFSVYVLAEKNGEKYCFEYKFDMAVSTDRPYAMNPVSAERLKELIKKKNTSAEKIYDAFDAYRRDRDFGEYEMFIPITDTGYLVERPTLVYVEEGSDMHEAVLVCASGYARVFDMEESATYSVSMGMPYETVRYRWCMPEFMGPMEGADEALRDHNTKDFLYWIKVDDNHYAYLRIYYYDTFNPPENAEEQIVDILKGMEIKITNN